MVNPLMVTSVENWTLMRVEWLGVNSGMITAPRLPTSLSSCATATVIDSVYVPAQTVIVPVALEPSESIADWIVVNPACGHCLRSSSTTSFEAACAGVTIEARRISRRTPVETEPRSAIFSLLLPCWPARIAVHWRERRASSQRRYLSGSGRYRSSCAVRARRSPSPALLYSNMYRLSVELARLRAKSGLTHTTRTLPRAWISATRPAGPTADHRRGCAPITTPSAPGACDTPRRPDCSRT